ncbi:short chain dehydrogenase reductase [Stachybotrys elegans]|uniref:Short chain dehydrogenase reductase n=1 Tax=Stachybotrys elegans TaxID=80388 RepID=A0A8K0WSS2_9HYPO|nr:short chain dehydrogenase reductase [Stachybotrys elegans]
MTSLNIVPEDFPRLDGKVAIITGGSSGIGLASAKILASLGARVHVLDLNSPIEEVSSGINYMHCNVADWPSLSAAFSQIGHVDIAIANAGVSEETDYFADTFSSTDGLLEEPTWRVVDVNFRAVLNFTKLSLSSFKRQGPGGSLVIVSSATAYSPEISLPVYSASKLGLVGLMRALRPRMEPFYGATINIVAPAATITSLLPANLAKPIMDAGAPVSSAHHVGLAVVHSAVAQQENQVEGYGRDTPEAVKSPGRWNGRCILTLGDHWTEIEEPLSRLRGDWFGAFNKEKTAFQQILTDIRPGISPVADAVQA